MNKIRAFFYTFFKSLTSLKYYKDVIKANVYFSIKYFFSLAAIAGTISVLLALSQIGEIKQGYNNALEQIRNLYPSDLVISYREGDISVNREEPFIIPLPQAVREQDGQLPTNLIVFSSEGTLDDVNNLDTLILVNDSNILVKGNNKIDVYPLENIEEGRITRAEVDRVINQLQSLSRFLPLIVALTSLVGAIFYYSIYRLLYLLFIGLLLMLLGKTKNLNLPFRNYFQIAVHTFTLPLTIGVLLDLARINLYFPLWIFLLNLAFGIFVLISFDGTEERVEQIALETDTDAAK
jgi:hypothetical protein